MRMEEDKELVKRAGKFCKKFRKDYMNMTMTDFAEKRGLKLNNVNAFERGGSNSIVYLLHYYDESNEVLKEVFKNNFFTIYERDEQIW